VDVSGSMNEEIGLIKSAFRMLTRQLRPNDTISIVSYAGNEAVVLDGAIGNDKNTILNAINNLETGGSTNGAGGIEKAYELALKHFKPNGNNRVILATDGDFNVGINDTDELVNFIKTKKETGIFLSTYGFATWNSGNFQDSKMEQLADNGNGSYYFIDGKEEARRAFMASLSGTLLTIAKDVKLQVQFNPRKIKGYRLIGYNNRILDNNDFNDDTVDAGELGNGEDVTAFYELILADSKEPVPPTPKEDNINNDDDTQYEALENSQYMAIRLRYKLPGSNESTLHTYPVSAVNNLKIPSVKFVFASSVAWFGLVLSNSAYVANANLITLEQKIKSVFTNFKMNAVNDFLQLVQDANAIKTR
jgi:Ca-activated chloride channel family protein